MSLAGDFEITEEDRQIGEELVAAGYYQTSAKYRHVARLPKGETATEAMMRHDPGLVTKIKQEIERRCADDYRRLGYANLDGNAKTLRPGEFKAFKAAGGKASW